MVNYKKMFTKCSQDIVIIITCQYLYFKVVLSHFIVWWCIGISEYKNALRIKVLVRNKTNDPASARSFATLVEVKLNITMVEGIYNMIEKMTTIVI